MNKYLSIFILLLSFNSFAETCLFGGWVSEIKNGKCTRPWRASQSTTLLECDNKECPGTRYENPCGRKDLFRCNPKIFGPGPTGDQVQKLIEGESEYLPKEVVGIGRYKKADAGICVKLTNKYKHVTRDCTRAFNKLSTITKKPWFEKLNAQNLIDTFKPNELKNYIEVFNEYCKKVKDKFEPNKEEFCSKYEDILPKLREKVDLINAANAAATVPKEAQDKLTPPVSQCIPGEPTSQSGEIDKRKALMAKIEQCTLGDATIKPKLKIIYEAFVNIVSSKQCSGFDLNVMKRNDCEIFLSQTFIEQYDDDRNNDKLLFTIQNNIGKYMEAHIYGIPTYNNAQQLNDDFDKQLPQLKARLCTNLEDKYKQKFLEAIDNYKTVFKEPCSEDEQLKGCKVHSKILEVEKEDNLDKRDWKQVCEVLQEDTIVSKDDKLEKMIGVQTNLQNSCNNAFPGYMLGLKLDSYWDNKCDVEDPVKPQAFCKNLKDICDGDSRVKDVRDLKRLCNDFPSKTSAIELKGAKELCGLLFPKVEEKAKAPKTDEGGKPTSSELDAAQDDEDKAAEDALKAEQEDDANPVLEIRPNPGEKRTPGFQLRYD